ncbi:MAG: ABC-three component system middle component 5 [Ktedonobacteraceae bacterium]
MITRLWYPQLDVYDAARRMSVLLGRWKNDPPSVERLYIIDFFLANPSLLYGVSLPQDVRAAFNALNVRRPEKLFISLPSAPLLFHKMEEVQRQAVRSLAGKGLIDNESIAKGLISLSAKGVGTLSKVIEKFVDESEEPVITFMINDFGIVDCSDIEAFRRRTGLHRVN